MTAAKKKKAATRRRGRKRAANVRREPNGRASRVDLKAQTGPTILDEAIAQRARATGNVVPLLAVLSEEQIEERRMDPSVPVVRVTEDLRKAMKDEYAGYPLGRLLLGGHISERQFTAGRSYAVLRRRWDKLADAPGRHARVARLPIASDNPFDMAPQVIDMLAMERESDIDGAWQRAKIHARQIRRRLVTFHGEHEALSVLEAVCVDEAAPVGVANWLPALRLALNTVANHFRLSPDKDEEIAA